MKNSRDKNKLKQLIHEYELGLLSEEQEKEFEILMLEDSDLQKDVLLFRKAANLLRRDPEVINTVSKLSAIKDTSMDKVRFFRFRFVTPSIAVALVLFFLLLVKPWHVEIQLDQTAMAASNRVLIFQFENKAEPEDSKDLGQILANLLITDLSESHYIEVIPDTRIENTLQQAALIHNNRLDSVAIEYAAKKLHANTVITGTIEQIVPKILLKIHIAEGNEFDSLITFNLVADNNESLYEFVDRLTIEIKNYLKLPTEAYKENDPHIVDVTTSSQTAYRFYLEGTKLYSKLYWEDAKNAFNLSLEYDSTFAMVYYYLSQLGDSKQIYKAMRYIDRTSRKERLYILSRNQMVEGNIDSSITILKQLVASFPDEKIAFYSISECFLFKRDYVTAISYLDSTLLIDSTFKLAYNQLAYSYNKLGDIDRSITSIDNYITLAPDEANPYDTRGDIYLSNGRIKEAIDSYKQALNIKPDFSISYIKLGHVFFKLNNIDSAEIYYKKANQSKDYLIRAEARLYLACLPILSGRFNKALSMLDDNITADIVENNEEYYSSYRFTKAYILKTINRNEEALQELKSSVAISKITFPQLLAHSYSFYAEMLAQCGKLNESQEVIDNIIHILSKRKHIKSPISYAMGALSNSRGEYDIAIEYYKQSLREDMYELPGRFAIGQIYLEKGEYQNAKDIFNDILTHYYVDYPLWAVYIVQAYYYYGYSCEKLGQIDEADASYKEFISLWGNSDSPLRIIDDARNKIRK
ncbi:MAG: tetratricopeptide repeat protein [bacterium]